MVIGCVVATAVLKRSATGLRCDKAKLSLAVVTIVNARAIGSDMAMLVMTGKTRNTSYIESGARCGSVAIILPTNAISIMAKEVFVFADDGIIWRQGF